jgi:hypothetical protein
VNRTAAASLKGDYTGLHITVWVCTHGTSQVKSSDDRVERRGEWVERLFGLTCRQVRAINWGGCRRALRSSGVKRRHIMDRVTQVFDLIHFGESR